MKSFAEEISKQILSSKNQGTVVLGLVGELGSGKTTFTQSLLKGLGVKKRILSPTFIIQKRFRLPKRSGYENVYHIDAHRIQGEDLMELGFGSILLGRNVAVVEWADRVRTILPKNTIWIRFKYGQRENERKITLN